MTRVFTGLAVGNLLLLLATGAWGLVEPDSSPEGHVVLAVFTLLLTAFVQVLTFTYFTVTGKIVGQAVHLAGHDVTVLAEVKRLKRSVTRHLVTVLAAAVLVTASGAAQWRTGGTSTLHLLCAGGFLSIAGLVWVREYALIVCNAQLLAPALGSYERWRSNKRVTGTSPERFGDQSRSVHHS